MNKLFNLISWVLLLLFIANTCLAQNTADSSKNKSKPVIVDSSADKKTPKKHIPRIATIRSAICPGLGQIYNKEYWKLPIVYGALAIPTYTFFYNDHYYSLTKYAYEAKYNAEHNKDSSGLAGIDPQLKNLDLNSLLKYRNAFRRDRDYSVMWFVILWGLNVVDATVFAHLKDFNVSDNLSMKIEPKFTPTGTFNVSSGLVLTFMLKSPKSKKVEIK